ncbi:MAG: hypothetical protein ACTSR2_15245, partial [Candidatus Hodarchaeales archaeon]
MRAEEIETQKICFDDVCLTKDQVKQILEKVGVQIPNSKSQISNNNQAPSSNNQTQEENIETQLISYPEKETTSTNAIFEFSSNIEGATYQCQINNQGWQPCESPKQYVNLTPGEYIFEVYAISQNGEYDQTPA